MELLTKNVSYPSTTLYYKQIITDEKVTELDRLND